VYTGSTETACEEVKQHLPPSDQTFFYPHDKYFDTPLQLPSQSSALIFNGGLDFATPQEFGELLYSKLDGSGDGVMMVNFAYGGHCSGEVDASHEKPRCRDSILASFIANDGNVTAVKTTCMKRVPGNVIISSA
jgi:hypothetical protein